VAATSLVTVEYVRSPLGADIDVLGRRPVLGIHRVPPGTIRLTVRGGPERLVVLRATARLNWLGPRSRNVATSNLPLRPGEVIVRPV
jgi:hypothetical protein